MSNQIVNLNKARKALARDQRKKSADQNAVVFGISKPDKKLQNSKNQKAGQDHAAHKRDV